MADTRKYLKLPQVLEELGGVASRATIYRWCSSGHFPAPLRLGPRMSVWLAAEVAQWQADRVADRDD